MITKNTANKALTDAHKDYIKVLKERIDDRNETIGKKIRESELSKIPYMIIIGEKEAKNNTISLRKHKKGDLGTIKIDELIEKINFEVNNINN